MVVLVGGGDGGLGVWLEGVWVGGWGIDGVVWDFLSCGCFRVWVFLGVCFVSCLRVMVFEKEDFGVVEVLIKKGIVFLDGVGKCC